MWSAYGIFAAAFPGFIVGYYTTVDGPLSSAGTVYGHVAIACLVSLVAVNILVLMLPVSSVRWFATLAAVAAGLYYWYAAPTITEAWAIDSAMTWVIRAVALALVATWFVRASWPQTANGSPT